MPSQDSDLSWPFLRGDEIRRIRHSASCPHEPGSRDPQGMDLALGSPEVVTDKPVADLGHLLLFLTQPGLNKWQWLKDRLFPSEAFLRYRYGDRWNTHPLLTRLFRPISLLSQAIKLFSRLVRLKMTGRV